MNDDVSKLTQLGSNKTDYKFEEPSIEILETFDNKGKGDYTIELKFPEFTSLCPKTSQPDFATIIIDYIPDKKCIESKSLKLYFFAYRNYGSFMETITNKIKNDLVSVCDPKYLKVKSFFNPRGGVAIDVTAIHQREC